MNELRQAIASRKKLMEESGYGNPDENELKSQLIKARDEYVELQARKGDFKSLSMVKSEEEKGQQSGHKPEHRSTRSTARKYSLQS